MFGGPRSVNAQTEWLRWENPKLEIRNPKEVRNPKPEIVVRPVLPPRRAQTNWQEKAGYTNNLSFRISAFGFLSVFEFRVSDFSCPSTGNVEGSY